MRYVGVVWNMMGVLWIFVFAVIADALELTDEQYHQMPKLFHLDDYEACLSSREGAFCVGTFDLSAKKNNRLFNRITQFTEDHYHFNRTRIHRGYCISTRCSNIKNESIEGIFENCVDDIMKTSYGLDTTLAKLDYCRTAGSASTMPVDNVDLAFGCLMIVIILANIIGTAYDFMRSSDSKPIRLLVSWSLIANFRRLCNFHKDGDTRLNILNPVHGMKSITLILVMLAHSVIVFHITYLINPHFLENASRHPLSTFLHNGSVVVQTFIMLSSFLLAYNLFLYVENNPKTGTSFLMLPKILFFRMVRIFPTYMFVVGATATWWRHLSDGPLWKPLVEAECLRCRDKWWAQALFIHNYIKPDDKCLLQTWFLAVDMQLYVVATVLVLLLVRWKQFATKILAGLFLASIVANFAISSVWNLKPILFVTFPELLRHQYAGEASFNWLYMAPWGSLPASLLGLYVAFRYYDLEQEGRNLKDSLRFRIIYRVSVPSLLVWIGAGYFIKDLDSPFVVALYAAIDRPIFTVIVCTAMVGFFHKIDGIYKFMMWRGWQVLSRMSLSILMVHWSYNLSQVAVKTNLSRASVYEISGHWYSTIVATYLTSLPLHLLVEAPFQKFLQNLVS